MATVRPAWWFLMFNAGIVGAFRRAGISLVHSGSGAAYGTGAMLVSLPASVLPGDVVLAALCGSFNGNANLSLSSDGYTKIADYHQASSAGSMASNLGIFTKVMGSAPDASVQFAGIGSNSMTSLLVGVFRGVSTTPMDVPPQVEYWPDHARTRVPSITPVTPGAVVVGALLGSSIYVSGAYGEIPAPTGFSNVVRNSIHNPTGGAHVSAGLFSKPWAGGASAASNYVLGYSSGTAPSSISVALALRPK